MGGSPGFVVEIVPRPTQLVGLGFSSICHPPAPFDVGL